MDKEQKLTYSIRFIAVLINIIVIANSLIHDPIIGYDADAHLDYMAVVVNHLPTSSDSAEYYSPPLPYIIPGIVYKSCALFSETDFESLVRCKLLGGHFAQGINAFLAILITILLIKICEIIKPGNKYFTLSTLMMFGGLTVFYKTFSQVRGEPYVAFFTILVTFIILKLFKDQKLFTWKASVLIGVVLGLLALSRQWGFLVFPAIFLFLLVSKIKFSSVSLRKFYITIIFTFSFAALVGSWFYFHLYHEFGKFTAYLMEEYKFSFSNQPLSFYRNTGLRHLLLFRSPTRKTFDNQFLPVFYSEIWGDYYGYFTYIREMPYYYQEHFNKEQITPYLGRVNFVSLLPTALFIGGFFLGINNLSNFIGKRIPEFNNFAMLLLFLIVVSSISGYFWYLIRYPAGAKGVTIKATYMIQIFMVLPLLAAELLESIRKKTKAYFVLIGLLALVFLHNLPAMISHYWWWIR